MNYVDNQKKNQICDRELNEAPERFEARYTFSIWINLQYVDNRLWSRTINKDIDNVEISGFDYETVTQVQITLLSGVSRKLKLRIRKT